MPDPDQLLNRPMLTCMCCAQEASLALAFQYAEHDLFEIGRALRDARSAGVPCRSAMTQPHDACSCSSLSASLAEEPHQGRAKQGPVQHEQVAEPQCHDCAMRACCNGRALHSDLSVSDDSSFLLLPQGCTPTRSSPCCGRCCRGWRRVGVQALRQHHEHSC